jgi:hypothetical protein
VQWYSPLAMLHGGCRAHRSRSGGSRESQNQCLAEALWKLAPQRVTAPYAKDTWSPVVTLSSTAPVKCRVNLRGPMRLGGWTAVTEASAGASESEQALRQAKRLGRRAAGGESPVAGGAGPLWWPLVSTAGHEEPRGKPGRPRSKAEYA